MRRTTIHIIWIGLFCFISCNLEYKSHSGIKFPDYSDTVKNSGIDYVVDEMVMCHNEVQHIDTLDFSNQIIDLNKQPKYGAYQKSSLEGYPSSKDSTKIQILIDTARIIPTKDNRIAYNLPPPPPSIFNELNSSTNVLDSVDSSEKSDENQVLEHGQIKNWVNNYPVYIVNSTDTIISLTYESLSGFVMIPEAKDSLGNWKPIQYWHWNWCGNTYSSIDLKPNHYVLTRIPKFSGEFKTKLRLKLRFFNKLYYSKEFNGSINQSQFIFPKELSIYDDRERNRMLLIE